MYSQRFCGQNFSQTSAEFLRKFVWLFIFPFVVVVAELCSAKKSGNVSGKYWITPPQDFNFVGIFGMFGWWITKNCSWCGFIKNFLQQQFIFQSQKMVWNVKTLPQSKNFIVMGIVWSLHYLHIKAMLKGFLW